MPLERQVIELPFFQGIDTKTDAKQIHLGKLLVLQNAVFTSPGKLQKRNGYTALTTNILGGGTISSGAALFTRANELCMTDTSSNLYSYDTSNTAWHSVGKMPSVTATLAPVASMQYTLRNLDIAVAPNGLQCVVFEMFDDNATSSMNLGVGYALIDSTSGQIVTPPTTIQSSQAYLPRVVAVGGMFCVFYALGDFATSQVIVGLTIDSTAPLTVLAGSGSTQTTGVGASAQAFASPNLDVCASSTAAYVVFNNRAGGTTVFKCAPGSPNIDPSVSATVSIAGTASTINTVFLDGTSVVIGFNTSATVVKEAVFDSTLGSTLKAATQIDTVTDAYRSITGVATATNTLRWFMGVGTGTNDLTQYTRTQTCTTASYTPGTASTLIRQLQPAAKAFAISGSAYIPCWFSTTLPQGGFTLYTPQGTIFLLDSSGNVLAKALSGSNGGFNTQGFATTHGSYGTLVQLPGSYVSSSTVTLAATTSTRISGFTHAGLTTISAYQFAAMAVSFNLSDTTNNYLRGQLANGVHTSGGCLQMYDGQTVTEHGFHIYPWGITGVAGAGGSLTQNAAYSYKVVYEWPDAMGQIHRSAPGTITGSTNIGANTKVTLTIPTLRVTAKTNVLVQVYRTLANGSVYYQISNFNLAGSLLNNKVNDTLTWVDTQADSSISTNPQLYTATGSTLPNIASPPVGPMCVHRNRLFVVDSTNPTRIYASQITASPAPVEFGDGIYLNVDPKGGAITALASLDDKLIVFKADRIFMVLGQGPDSTGGQNDWTDAILVSSDTGCAVPKSVVVVPDGLMFQSPKGIYQLSRALQVSYIGAPLEGLASLNPAAAGTFVSHAIESTTYNEVRFGFADDGNGIMGASYNYLTGQWSEVITAATEAAIDGALWAAGAASRVHVFLTSNPAGTVKQETPGAFSDTAAYVTTITTGWIKLSGLQGFQRVWRLLVLGEYKSPHTLTVTVAYNYNTTTVQTFTFAVSSDPAPYQFRCHLAQQKCEAIRVTISDSAQSGTKESFSLSGLALEVGLKKGPYRLPAAQSG